MGLTRGLHPDVIAALRGVFHPILMIDLDWPGSPVRAHSGAGPISWSGHTFVGVGSFGEIEVPAETTGLAATSVSLSLLGMPEDIWTALGARTRNRPGTIWWALTTEPGGNILIGEPMSLFAGHMDATRYLLRKDGEDRTHAIQIEISSGPGARSRSAVLHSYESQIAEYPGDTAGRHLINIEAETENMQWPE